MIEAVLRRPTKRFAPVHTRSVAPERDNSHADEGTGITLDKLLGVAALKPAQAALLLTDVIRQLEVAHRQGGSPLHPDGSSVMVSEAGRLRIDPIARAASRDEVDAVVSLLRSITTNCPGCAFADRLDEAIAEASDPTSLARLVRREIQAPSEPAEEQRTRRQLAKLVSAISGYPLPDRRAPAQSARVDAPPKPAAGPSLAPAGWYPPVRSAWHRKKRRPSRRRVLVLLTVVAILIGALWFAPNVWSELRRGWAAVLDPVDTSELNQIRPVSPPPPLPPEPVPVDTGAPAKAGPITEVTATLAEGACAAAKPCDVRVDVHLESTAHVDAVSWNLRVYDLCSGQVDTSAQVTMAPQPGRQQVYGISRATLPPGSAFALAAVTAAPAVAASEPVFVPAENAPC